MTKISIVIPTGEKVEAELVRFFEVYGKKYLVYTLNEKDEQGFVKLYVARVDDADATGARTLAGEFIEDDNEWKFVKDEFKKIIGENNDGGHTSANDLNPADLANINVRGHRVIKLMESYVNLLSANQKQFGFQPQIEPFAPETPAYQAPASPFPEAPAYQAPVQPVAPGMPTNDFGYRPAPDAQQQYQGFPGYQPQANFGIPEAPASPFPETPAYQAPVQPKQAATQNNYEAMYNELKTKFDRCNAELEKVTNENIELRIKIDDIREILNEN